MKDLFDYKWDKDFCNIFDSVAAGYQVEGYYEIIRSAIEDSGVRIYVYLFTEKQASYNLEEFRHSTFKRTKKELEIRLHTYYALLETPKKARFDLIDL